MKIKKVVDEDSCKDNYEDAVRQLAETVYRRGINYGLDHVSAALCQLNNPHLKLQTTIHVAGTNGKGSTIAFLEGMLLENGYSVGKYTSPHIETYRERIQYNQTKISPQQFAALFTKVSLVDAILTEFEQLTLMAFCFFQDKQPDFVLLETGLGGRLDATNVVTPSLSIITSISKDHEAILGNSLAKIATEKAGVIKENTPIITCQQDASVHKVLKKKADDMNVPLIIAENAKSLPAKSQLQAAYQGENYGLAIAGLKQLGVVIKHPVVGNYVRHWGRFTLIEGQVAGKAKKIIVDVAHNQKGLAELFDLLNNHYKALEVSILIGLIDQKNIKDILPIINQYKGNIYYCEFAKIAHRWETIKAGVPQAQSWRLGAELPNSPLVVLTGSHYFVSELKKRYEVLSQRD